MSNFKEPFLEFLSTAATNGTSNTTTASPFSDYNIVVVSLNSPFVLIFGILFLSSVISYLVQHNSMKRNQHILFSILFVLESLVCINMLTRIASEVALLHPVPAEGRVASVVIKIFDRCFVNMAIYVEVVLMAHICFIFAETCRAINTFNEVTFGRIKKLIIIFLFILGFLFVAFCGFTALTGALTVAKLPIDPALLNYLTLALFLCAAALFFISTVSVSILLNVVGRKLSQSLQDSKRRIKNMLKVATSSTTPSSKDNHSSKEHVESHHQTDKTKSIEQIRNYKFKKVALRKAMAIQYGLTFSLLFQFVGFIFIPISLSWNYAMNFFHMLYNIGIVAFIVLILSIYHPMREVQKLFRADSDKNLLLTASQASMSQSSSQSHHRHNKHLSSSSVSDTGVGESKLSLSETPNQTEMLTIVSQNKTLCANFVEPITSPMSDISTSDLSSTSV
ncbi:hypothetical protein C9374_006811 [Naegleria lovaniensis]|uniref:Uncharacterized protein n=1 Tax=Naegleria lovaniensis TaxID=51637 RepID=A0AA88KXI9_NAELO|nr:uncharacterized protein C9374_006811 [Naegleria lovaniensis]KAG2393280.1 hypothetical protein C9374_006811 [Naegleria lovaniensis]